METIKIDILNPKAKPILDSLADLDLIHIKKERIKSELQELLDKFRADAGDALPFDEISKEVEAVRKARYEK